LAWPGPTGNQRFRRQAIKLLEFEILTTKTQVFATAIPIKEAPQIKNEGD
jgi:hypothetical protein